MADGSIIIDTRIDSSGAENGVKSLGKLGGMASNALGVATKAAAGMAVGITAATGAVIALTKASVEQYAQYEQLTGGVETLFKNSSDTVIQYANVAYKTAGLSANEYMSTITGFSASLLQGLGGDTKKAADIGNQAVIDMSDNANKMGTSMENIQNAYQGFAKQNYTMLDNLKLGYGGTKTEMERLLSDAEKISGVHYDINNFSDVIQAIHTIQDQMGITGTTAKEAMSTIEGSLNMTKAAWKNMLTGMADDNADFDVLVDNLVESLGALGENLMPRIGIALNGVGQLIDKLLPVVLDKIPEIISSILPNMIDSGANIATSLGNAILQSLPTIINYGTELIQNLLTRMQENIPSIIDGLVTAMTSLTVGINQILPQLLGLIMQGLTSLMNNIVQQAPTLIQSSMQAIIDFITTFLSNAPDLLDAALALVQGLADGIINSIPVLTESLPQLIQGIIDFISNNLPQLLQSGQEIILQMLNGMIQAIPSIIAMLPQIIDSIVQFITGNLPQIINTGIQVILALIDGFINALPQLIAMLPQIINSISTGLLGHLPEIIQAGIQIIVALAGGLLQAIPQLIGAIPQIVSSLFNAFTSVNWGEIGINIIKGIGVGVTGAVKGLVDVGIKACKSLKDSVCNFFDIHSPSRLMRDLVGKNIIAGIQVGMEQQSSSLMDTATNICTQLTNQFGNILNKESAEDVINRFKSITGTLGKLTNELNTAQERVDWANGLTLDDNKWYYDAKERLEEVKSKIENIRDLESDTEDKNYKKSLQQQQKVLEKKQKLIQKEFDYYKEAAQKEIDTRREATKKELQIAKEKYSRLESLSKALTTAIKNQINEQKDAAINAIESEEDAEEKTYNRRIDKAESYSNRRIKSIKRSADREIAEIERIGNARIDNLQAQKNALDELTKSEDRNAQRQEISNNIAVLQAKLANTKSEADKQALQMKIDSARKEAEIQEHKWSVEDQKAELDAQINAEKEAMQEKVDTVKEEADRKTEIEEERLERKKERLKKEYEEEKRQLEKRKRATEEYYETLLEEDSINAQARYMLLTRSNDELVQLLQSYNPLWQDAGQSLADSLIHGLNSKKGDMASAVAEMTSLRNGISIDGYATGTTFNRIAGAYTVDEKGFELSTGNNPVAYVSRGAGILNHMQSLNAIKKEVSKQMSVYADKLRNAVFADQYRMGRLALASFGGYNSNSNTTNNNDNSSINFNVEHFHNENNSSIEDVANELGFHARRNKKY